PEAANFSGGDKSVIAECVRMSAFDAAGQRISCSGHRRMERWTRRSSDYRTGGICLGDFAEHALRHRGNTRQLRVAGGFRFLHRVSPLDAISWNGIRALAFL